MPFPFSARQPEYAAAWASCVIKDENRGEVMSVARKIIANRPRYEPISRATGVPWYVIGIIHAMECDKFPAFTQHLHNGDPLSSKTVQEPANRPAGQWPRQGQDPFEASAIDALTMKGKEFHKVTDWTVDRIAYCLETYNGFGYVPRKIHSPYLWSYTNQYSKGKYIADGPKGWSAAAVSKQCGAMALLKALIELDPQGVDLDHTSEPQKEFPRAEVPSAPYMAVASTSKSVWATILSILAVMGNYFESLLGWIPEIKSEADGVLAPLGSLSGMLKINIAGITVAIVVLCALVVIARHTKDKAELKTLKGE